MCDAFAVSFICHLTAFLSLIFYATVSNINEFVVGSMLSYAYLCCNRTLDHIYEVPAELFKAGLETVLDRMHRICVTFWETGEWPEERTFSTFIPLPKKGDLKQRANYRTILLLSHMQARSVFGSYWKGSE